MQNISKLDSRARALKGAQAASGNSATIEADEGTNSLIITADADEMAALEAVVQRLDIRRAQVLVEAIIVELEVIDGQDLGLQWLFANDTASSAATSTPATPGPGPSPAPSCRRTAADGGTGHRDHR
jgi:general secretion pathway protein D